MEIVKKYPRNRNQRKTLRYRRKKSFWAGLAPVGEKWTVFKFRKQYNIQADVNGTINTWFPARDAIGSGSFQSMAPYFGMAKIISVTLKIAINPSVDTSVAGATYIYAASTHVDYSLAVQPATLLGHTNLVTMPSNAQRIYKAKWLINKNDSDENKFYSTQGAATANDLGGIMLYFDGAGALSGTVPLALVLETVVIFKENFALAY